jgi:hypothetical protein
LIQVQVVEIEIEESEPLMKKSPLTRSLNEE